MTGRELNKRAVENFIKAGALDCFEGNRKQLMLVYSQVMDSVSKEKKTSMAGQMSLFDLVSEEDKKDFDIQLPNVAEFEKEELLFMEKEVLGVYISGHPLEEYQEKWQKNITKVTSDFYVDEETNLPHVMDGESVMVGGMITERTIKYTKNNKTMAFLTLEDLVGTVEIIVFPRDYERYNHLMQTDQKIFVKGRVSVEEEKNGKLICEKIYSFDEAKRELWLQFETMEEYEQKMKEIEPVLKDSDGSDQVVIYISTLKAMKRLGQNQTVLADSSLVCVLKRILSEKNVKVVEKSIENFAKRG